MCSTLLSQQCFTGIKGIQVMGDMVVELAWGLKGERGNGTKSRSRLPRLSSAGLLLSRVKGTTWGGEVWSTKPHSLAQTAKFTAHRLQNLWGLSEAWPTRLRDHEPKDLLEPSPSNEGKDFSVCSVFLTALCD